jgi:hypothetical protein
MKNVNVHVPLKLRSGCELDLNSFLSNFAEIDFQDLDLPDPSIYSTTIFLNSYQ